jgi:uncharacterized protein YecE (DUF72 family)
LNTVEGNTTFYALPNVETTERWRDETPSGFKFCLKAPQQISHRLRLQNAQAETEQLFDRLQRLQDRCGPVFLQLPPTFNHKHLPILDAYLANWSKEFRIAVEPRHADFFGDGENEFEDVLRSRDAARCVFDTVALFSAPNDYSADVTEAQSRKPKFPTRTSRTSSFAFVRYVSHPNVESNRVLLSEWAKHIAPWLGNNDDVFFFAHHPDDTFAPNVIRLFHSVLSEIYKVPPLPEWGESDPHIQPQLVQTHDRVDRRQRLRRHR